MTEYMKYNKLKNFISILHLTLNIKYYKYNINVIKKKKYDAKNIM